MAYFECKIKEFAKEKFGWTTKELAEAIGLHPQTITGWTGLASRPSYDTLAKACDIMDCKISDLMILVGERIVTKYKFKRLTPGEVNCILEREGCALRMTELELSVSMKKLCSRIPVDCFIKVLIEKNDKEKIRYFIIDVLIYALSRASKFDKENKFKDDLAFIKYCRSLYPFSQSGEAEVARRGLTSLSEISEKRISNKFNLMRHLSFALSGTAYMFLTSQPFDSLFDYVLTHCKDVMTDGKEGNAYSKAVKHEELLIEKYMQSIMED